MQVCRIVKGYFYVKFQKSEGERERWRELQILSSCQHFNILTQLIHLQSYCAVFEADYIHACIPNDIFKFLSFSVFFFATFYFSLFIFCLLMVTAFDILNGYVFMIVVVVVVVCIEYAKSRTHF